MASRRRGHADPADFARDLNGNYSYTGPHYRYAGALPRRRLLARLWALAAVLLAALVAAGCLPAAGVAEGCFYVVLPGAVALVAAVSVVWGLARLTAAGDPLREYVYEATVLAVPGRALLTAVLAALALAGQGAYLLLHGAGGRLAASLGCLLLQAAACAAGLCLRRVLRREKWGKK